MYRIIEIDGFRGLHSCVIDEPSRVNIITGLNGSGKTSILEAIQLHAKPLDLNALIQLDPTRIGIPFQIVSLQQAAPWKNLFGSDNQFQINGQYGIRDWRVHVKESAQSTAAISFPRVNTDHISAPGFNVPVNTPIGDITATCSENDHTYYSTATAFQNGGIAFNQAMGSDANPPFVNCVRVLSGPRNGPTIAALFSQLLGTSAEDRVLSIAQSVEPRLRRLTVWTNGQYSALHGDVGTSTTLDLSLISDGLYRATSAAIAVSQSMDGVCLIDEFENGIHVSALGKVWKGIYEACKEFNVQLFATTHSRECAQAAFTDISHKDDLALYRVDSDERNHKTKIAKFDAVMLETAFDSGIEIR